MAPAAAIVSRDGHDVAFVVTGDGNDHRVQRRTLKLGRTLGDDREVLDGLAGGDSVVLDPPPALANGDAVRVAGQDSNTTDTE